MTTPPPRRSPAPGWIPLDPATLWDLPEEQAGAHARSPGAQEEREDGGSSPPREVAAAAEEETSAIFQEVRGAVHRRLLERLNLGSLSRLGRDAAEPEVRALARNILADEGAPLNAGERVRIVDEIVDEVFGLGPLQPLLDDRTISDILVNTHRGVWVERDGKLHRVGVRFRDEAHLRQIIERIVSAVGRRIDESSPMVDARLADGSRVNAILSPLAVDGPHLSIRKFRRDVLTAGDLVGRGSLTPELLGFLDACIRARLNLVISGGTGSGKTTLLNVLSASIPADERVVTIEDSAELQLRQPHVVRLETRPANIEGEGRVTQRDLVVNALRMRPDRIIVGEVRGDEAIDMLQAMNTGHDGSLTTVHANSPRDALARIETMVSMSGIGIGEAGARAQIASAIDLVVQVARLPDGTRRVTSLSEITGMEGPIVSMQEIFRFDRRGVDRDGQVIGTIRPTGVRPAAADLMEQRGVSLDPSLFLGRAETGGAP